MSGFGITGPSGLFCGGQLRYSAVSTEVVYILSKVRQFPLKEFLGFSSCT